IDGIGSRPFSARTLHPIPEPEISHREGVIEASRKNFAQPRALVEEKIKKWFEPVKQPEKRTIAQPNEKTSLQTAIKKQSFVVEKKTATPSDTHDAEFEMKQVVS